MQRAKDQARMADQFEAVPAKPMTHLISGPSLCTLAGTVTPTPEDDHSEPEGHEAVPW
jgi:hypothetical protein